MPKAKKGYKIICDNIDAIPPNKRVAYCRSCATYKGEKTRLDEKKCILVKLAGHNCYAVIGPCANCGRRRCCYVQKPLGTLLNKGVALVKGALMIVNSDVIDVSAGRLEGITIPADGIPDTANGVADHGVL